MSSASSSARSSGANSCAGAPRAGAGAAGDSGGASTMTSRSGPACGSGPAGVFRVGHAGSFLAADEVVGVAVCGLESRDGRRRPPSWRFIDAEALRGAARRARAAGGGGRRTGLQLVAKRCLQIGGRRPGEIGIVVVMAEAAVAFVAEQAADLAGHMTMVDAQRAMLLADPADAALACQERVKSLAGQAVAAFDGSCPTGLAGNHRCFPPQSLGGIAGEIAWRAGRPPAPPRPANDLSESKNPRGGCRRAQECQSHFAIYLSCAPESRGLFLRFFRLSAPHRGRPTAPAARAQCFDSAFRAAASSGRSALPPAPSAASFSR